MAVHQHATPDEWAHAAQDDAELVDTEWCGSGSHALRVAQSIRPLKGSPQYLALSFLRFLVRCYPRELTGIAQPGD